MADTDLMQLYSGRLLALAADIPHLGRLTNPHASAEVRAPLCGSKVTVDLCLEQGRISAFAQDVRACALGQAAASVLGEVVIGTTPAQLRQARAELAAMLDGAPAPQAPFDGFEALAAARGFKNRHASIQLALQATLEALEKITP